jgi:transcription elongation factor Elf1
MKKSLECLKEMSLDSNESGQIAKLLLDLRQYFNCPHCNDICKQGIHGNITLKEIENQLYRVLALCK